MIGLSLTFCISDIIDGTVDVDDVEKIIAGTAYTEEMLPAKLDEFCQLYWRDNPEYAREVFWNLWHSGRIEQPRLTGYEYYSVNLCGGHWL